MSSTNGTATQTETVTNRVPMSGAEIARQSLAKNGSKGRIKGVLVVKGVEISKATLRSGLTTFTDEQFDSAAQAAGIDVVMDVDATFHGVFRAKKHTDRVVGDNALEFIADLEEANDKE